MKIRQKKKQNVSVCIHVSSLQCRHGAFQVLPHPFHAHQRKAVCPLIFRPGNGLLPLVTLSYADASSKPMGRIPVSMPFIMFSFCTSAFFFLGFFFLASICIKKSRCLFSMILPFKQCKHSAIMTKLSRTRGPPASIAGLPRVNSVRNRRMPPVRWDCACNNDSKSCTSCKLLLDTSNVVTLSKHAMCSTCCKPQAEAFNDTNCCDMASIEALSNSTAWLGSLNRCPLMSNCSNRGQCSSPTMKLMQFRANDNRFKPDNEDKPSITTMSLSCKSNCSNVFKQFGCNPVMQVMTLEFK